MQLLGAVPALGQVSSEGLKYVRFCKLAGCIVVNYSENDRIKVILEEYL
jgi:hypothetical protein